MKKDEGVTLRDHVAAALYPFAIDQYSKTQFHWTDEAGRRKHLRDLAKICYMAADEFVKARK